MKKGLIRLFSVILYIAAIMAVLGLKLDKLLDWRLLVLEVLGMVVMAAPFYQKKDNHEEKAQLLAQKALEAGYLQSLILLFICLSKAKQNSNIPYELAINCRPIIYGYLIYVLLEVKPYTKAHKDTPADEKAEKVSKESVKPLSTTEIYQQFRKLGLTEREAEVAKAICKGMSNGEIAEELFISEATVKKHVSHIFDKLHIEKREGVREKLKEFSEQREERS